MLNDSDRKDLLITALEGGSNYWYFIPDVIRRKGQDLIDAIWEEVISGLSVTVQDLEDFEYLGDISIEGMETAESILEVDFPEVYQRILEGQYDAFDADLWFQLTVMGEVVFA